jgi:hypothetical protein
MYSFQQKRAESPGSLFMALLWSFDLFLSFSFHIRHRWCQRNKLVWASVYPLADRSRAPHLVRFPLTSICFSVPQIKHEKWNQVFFTKARK